VPGDCNTKGRRRTRARGAGQVKKKNLEKKCVDLKSKINTYGSSRARAPRDRMLTYAQHTSAYVRIRQHTSVYVSIRMRRALRVRVHARSAPKGAYVSIRQHKSAYVCVELFR
jgi:hypothetical protein